MQGLRIISYLFVISILSTFDLNAQCPQVNIEITNVQGIGCETNPLQSGEMCPLDFFTIFLEQDILLPPNTEIDWYKNTDSNVDFDDENYIGTSQINTNPSTVSECAPCPEILGILVDACQGGNYGNESENEFVVISSGGGFNVSDLSFDFFSTNNFHPDPTLLPFHGDINTMNSICELMFPQASLITSVSNSIQCTQVFGAGPGDYIPSGALVLLFTNCVVTIDYDFNDMCANGAPIYVLQNSCCRERGAFTNPDGDPGFRTQILNLSGPNCNCTSELTYQTNDPVLSSIPGGGGAGIVYYGLDGDLISIYDQNCVAPPVTLIPLPPLTSTLDPFAYIVSYEDCGETIFIQGLLSPTFEGCPETTTDIFTFEVNCIEPELSDEEICIGGTIDLDDLNLDNLNGGWVTESGLPVDEFSPTELGDVSFIFYPTECCIDSAQVTIEVIDGARVDIVPDTSVCVTFGVIDLDGLINTDPLPTGTWSIGSNMFDPSNSIPDDVITISFIPDDECGIEVSTEIIIAASPDSIITAAICENKSIEINGELFHINNPSMTFTIPSTEGCDTLVNVNVSFFDLPESNFVDTICYDGSIMVGDSLFDNQTASGIVTFSNDLNSSDCDSLVNVSIIVLPEVLEGPDDLQERCAGNDETYEIHNAVFDENNPSGLITIQNANGCDSSFMVIVNFLAPITGEDFRDQFCAGSGENVMLGGIIFDENNPTGEAILSSQVTGCDSLVNVNLTYVTAAAGNDVNEQTCDPNFSLDYDNGQIFDINNPNGMVTLTSSEGCDSTFMVSIDFSGDVQGPDINEQTCDPDFVLDFGDGQVFDLNNQEGMVTLTSSESCDSTFLVSIEFSFLIDILPVFISTCDPNFSIDYGDGQLFDQNNTSGEVTLITSEGCDSTFLVNIDFSDNVQGQDINDQTCDTNFSLDFGNGQVFDANNPNGMVTLTSSEGCDSTFMVNIDFSTDVQGQNINEQTCDNDFSLDFGNGQVFDANNPSGMVTLTSSEGCDSTFMVNIDFSTDVQGQNINEQTCDNNFFLDFGNGQIFDANNPSGMVTLNSSEGCDSTFMVNIDFQGAISGVDLSYQTCEASFMVDFGNGQIFNINQPEGMVTIPSSTGCDSTFMVTINFGTPSTTSIQETYCSGDPFEININGTIYNEGNPMGSVTLSGANNSGCDSTVFVNLTFEEIPISLTAAPNKICSGEEVIMTVNFPSTEIIIIEINKSDGTVQAYNNVTDGFSFSDFVDTNTSYTISQVTGVDCPELSSLSEVSIEVSELSIELIASNYNGYEVSCEGAENGFIDVIFENEGVGNLNYIWSNGATEPSLNNLSVGSYSLTVSDETGCESIAEITLNEPDQIAVAYDVQNPGCLGLASGSITVNEIQGGAGNFSIAINDEDIPLGTVQTPVTYNNLAPGSYTLNFIDGNSCQYSEEVLIEENSDLELQTPRTVEINLGDSYQISLQANFDIDSIAWSQVDGLSCYDCINPIANPENTAVYEVKAWSADGCNTTAMITFFVRRDFDYYIPTAFSPNKDGFNDGFTVYSGEDVISIPTLAIFDRWGSQVFLGTNLSPNNIQQGWDGEKNGQDYPPGVYVYYAEIELSTSEIILEEGDVILMR